MRHIVALSGGKDSTAMALRLAEVEPQDYEYVITPTGNELPEMFAHWRKLGEMLGSPLKPIPTVSLTGEIERQKCLPNYRMRWCTRLIKIEPFQRFLLSAAPAVSYVGIRADETDREGVDHEQIGEEIQNRYPLVEWGWGYNHVVEYLASQAVQVPARTDCAMCFYQRLAEWWQLWKDHPDKYQEAEDLEVKFGHSLRSKHRDSWPAYLRDLRGRFEIGEIPKGAGQGALFRSDNRKAMCSFCAR